MEQRFNMGQKRKAMRRQIKTRKSAKQNQKAESRLDKKRMKKDQGRIIVAMRQLPRGFFLEN
jgi:hypothetical protein